MLWANRKHWPASLRTTGLFGDSVCVRLCYVSALNKCESDSEQPLVAAGHLIQFWNQKHDRQQRELWCINKLTEGYQSSHRSSRFSTVGPARSSKSTYMFPLFCWLKIVASVAFTVGFHLSEESDRVTNWILLYIHKTLFSLTWSVSMTI